MGDKPVFGETITVSMTPAQKVHMALEAENYDNLRHMAGGRTFADKELYSKGKRNEAFAQGRTVKLAPETVKKIVSDLTEEERGLYNALKPFYNEYSKEEINRVSNILYGYDKAMNATYAPIYTNQNFTKSEPGVFNVTAEGVGNLKARQYSKNPSLNISAFDAFERSVERTARFVGLAIPVRNMNTLMNWRESSDSMADVLTHKWGEGAKRFVEDLLTELQAGQEITGGKLDSMSDEAQLAAIGNLIGTDMETSTGSPTQWAKLNTAINDGYSVSDAVRMLQDGTLDTYMKWRESDIRAAGVDAETYIAYKAEVSEITADKDANGKSISGSKKEKVLAYIDGLKLTNAQKDALYYEQGYAESGIDDTPWNARGPQGLSLPSLGTAQSDEKELQGLSLPSLAG